MEKLDEITEESDHTRIMLKTNSDLQWEDTCSQVPHRARREWNRFNRLAVLAAKLGTEGGITGVDMSAELLPLTVAKGCCEDAVLGAGTGSFDANISVGVIFCAEKFDTCFRLYGSRDLSRSPFFLLS